MTLDQRLRQGKGVSHEAAALFLIMVCIVRDLASSVAASARGDRMLPRKSPDALVRGP